MSSTCIDIPGSAMAGSVVDDGIKEKGMYTSEPQLNTYVPDDDCSDTTQLRDRYDFTHRQLRPRHIQLIGIGGTIGTALFVSIGEGLIHGGPASLFIAFTLW